MVFQRNQAAFFYLKKNQYHTVYLSDILVIIQIHIMIRLLDLKAYFSYPTMPFDIARIIRRLR